MKAGDVQEGMKAGDAVKEGMKAQRSEGKPRMTGKKNGKAGRRRGKPRQQKQGRMEEGKGRRKCGEKVKVEIGDE